MTREEILLQALHKAQANGYMPGYTKIAFNSAGDWINVSMKPETGEGGLYINYEAVIFSKNFAKAFFGTTYGHLMKTDMGETVWVSEGFSSGSQIKWEECLKEMVLEEEPLKYLEKFL